MRQRSTALAVVAAAFLACVPGLAACGGESEPTASESPSPTATPSAAAPAPAAPLPAPEALTDVLYKLADTSVPGAKKINLIQGATADNAAQIDKFGKALVDNQYTPLGFTAENIAWSDTDHGNVTADVTVHSQNPALGGGFMFPTEFRPFQGGWQLSRTTADILLTLGQNPAVTPGLGPPPAPGPAPASPAPTPTG